MSCEACTVPSIANVIVTDLTIHVFPSTNIPTDLELDSGQWHRVEKELYSYSSQHCAWLYVQIADAEKLTAEDEVVMNIGVGVQPPQLDPDLPWESRSGGIWIMKSRFSAKIRNAVTAVDVLFGTDAVDPRRQWSLSQEPLQLIYPPQAPVARLSVLHDKAPSVPDTPPTIRVKEDGTFKIVQISDTHMVTGVGVCKDAIDAHGKHLPESEADPLTVKFIEKVLDHEQPDLVVFTGDQIHHDVSDTQSALFKAVAPAIERSIPFATVFGNHDSEGTHALSRK